MFEYWGGDIKKDKGRRTKQYYHRIKDEVSLKKMLADSGNFIGIGPKKIIMGTESYYSTWWKIRNYSQKSYV